LLTLPVGGSFLYVEPLYVQSSFPTLERVLVSYGGRLGYGATLSDALSDLQPGHFTGETLNTLGTTTPTSTPSNTSSPPSSPSGSPSSSAPSSKDALLAQINQALADLQTAYKSGDFTRIGTAQSKLQQLLQQYESQYGSPTSSPTPSPSKSK
jgi:uncharacterized protein